MSVGPNSSQESDGPDLLHGIESPLARALEVAGGVGTWDWDLTTDLIYSNERFATLFRVDPLIAARDGVKSSDYIAAIHPEDQHLVEERTQQAIATTGPYVVEFRLPQKNGSDLWIYALGHAYRDVNGNPSRFPGAAMDITQRKHMEAELKVARDRAETILESITDGFFTLDQNFCFLYVNQAAEQILFARREDLLGKSLWDLYPEALGTEIQHQYERTVREKVPPGFEWFFKEWNRWFSLKVYPTNEAGLSVYFRDISEQKHAEEKERERQEHLRESARLESLGVMAGGIAHDFNNLLTGILGNASFLAEDLSGRDREKADQIVLAAQRAADLTKQMLDFSGKGSFAVEAVDLNTLLQENLTLLRASSLRTVSVEVETSDEACVIEADRGQIQQIVMNLLINAAEAISQPRGKIEVRTLVTEVKESHHSSILRQNVPPGRYTVLEVRDNGSGISPETLKRIFDPFFTTKFTGRGLGLAAVLGIVKGHKGDIEIVTEPGMGSTFRVFLPASERANLATDAPQPVPAVPSTYLTVLFVDDEEIIRNFASEVLKRKGFRVLVATNGAEALDRVRVNLGISLVILDLTMLVMTGEEAIPLIKALRPGLPIILSSGYSENELSRRFASAGISGFLPKPYTAAVLLRKSTEVLQNVP